MPASSFADKRLIPRQTQLTWRQREALRHLWDQWYTGGAYFGVVISGVTRMTEKELKELVAGLAVAQAEFQAAMGRARAEFRK